MLFFRTTQLTYGNNIITVQFKHFILQQQEATKEQNKNLIMSHHQFSKFEKKKEQILILIKTTFWSSTNSSFPYESKLPQKICEKERFPDANFLFLSYLNNQTKESIERKGKKYPISNDSTESTQSTSSSSKTLSLSPSLPASASSDSLYRKPNQTQRTWMKKKEHKQRAQKRVLNVKRES